MVSLAVLADSSPRFRPGPYEQETLGCRVRFKYPYCKLVDFDRAMLERENNPAAVVILAHRTAQERRKDPAQRETLKWALTRQLYERGYSKEDIQELFRLIDWLVQLPGEQEIEFRRKIVEYEAQKHMPYITSIERMGREEGLRPAPSSLREDRGSSCSYVLGDAVAPGSTGVHSVVSRLHVCSPMAFSCS